MTDKTRLKELLMRSIRFDSEYLNNLDSFLKLNFKKVLYALKTNKRSFEKKELNELFLSMEKIEHENIQNIEVLAYKDDEVALWGSEDLCLTFYKRYFLPTVVYTYKDGQENEDVGFLKKLDEFLKKYRFDYAFLFDDGLIPMHGKYAGNFLVRIGLALGMAYLFQYWMNIKFVFLSWEYLLTSVWFFYVFSIILKYFFPRLVFILTKKEKDYRCRYNSVRKLLLWFMGGLFFIVLGILIERYLK